MKALKSKKGVLQGLEDLMQGLGSVVIIMVVVFLIIANVKSNSTVAADPNATAAVTETQEAASDIPTWLPLIVIVFIGGLLLTLVRFMKRK